MIYVKFWFYNVLNVIHVWPFSFSRHNSTVATGTLVYFRYLPT